jgi:hypothetical protein
MLRETTFLVGGVLMVGLGVSLGVGLYWAGAGWLYFGAWSGAGIAVGLGVFFVHVSAEERRERRRFLAGYDPGPRTPP